MSQFDVVAAAYLNSTVLPILLVIIGLIVVVKNRVPIRQRFFAKLFTHLSKGYNRDLDSTKAELFRELQDFKSLDWDLRNKGLIRVLEIGVGPGSNFKFYPQNSRVTAVDPNPYFRQRLDENSSHFPNLKMEKVVLGEGEDLAEVRDESIDVVITTIVMCSVKDVSVVLREIKRVLAPGGKYFFLEHVLGDKGTSYYRWQRVLEPVWSHLFDGCHITRDFGKMIEQTGFSNVHTKKFIAPLKSILRHVVGPHIMGTVQK